MIYTATFALAYNDICISVDQISARLSKISIPFEIDVFCQHQQECIRESSLPLKVLKCQTKISEESKAAVLLV